MAPRLGITHFRLPDIVPGEEWPFSCPTHSLAAKANTESLRWLKSFGQHSERALLNFSRYRIDVLVSWSYRHSGPDHYQLCSDLMYLYWLIDDITDKQTTEAALREADHMKIALADPFAPPPQNEAVLGKAVRSFWGTVLTKLNPPPQSKARFIKNFTSYINSLPEEAEDRQTGRLRNIEEHFHLRRRTGGLLPSFDFIYMPFELPDAIADHPHINRMTLAVGDLVITANDIYSWNVEQAGGQMTVAHNIVDVVKREKGLDMQGAFDFVEGMYLDIQKGLLDDLKNIPTFEGPENKVLKFYVEGLVEWVQGNVEFSLASGRYFRDLMGDADIRKTRLVAIYPPKRSLLGLWAMLQAYFAFFMAWLMYMIQRYILLRYKQL
ncbi:terpenoid synthase [Phlegmacium glaucopus]|nr:terpenoid synthase [Phlegmacium glaucopus]